MQRLKEAKRRNKEYYIMIAILSFLLFMFYFRHLYMVNTVFELPDEYGYLTNAEHFVRGNWISCLTSYYGFGYSMVLVPLFVMCRTGTELIHGAILINSICVVFMFWVEILLASKLCNRMNKYLTILAAFGLCFYPYIISSSMKVFCECFLSLMIWVLWLLLYKVLDTGQSRFFVLLGMILPYLFFIHTRTIPIILATVLLMMYLYIRKQIKTESVFSFFIPCIIVFGVGFWLKKHLIAEVYTNQLADDVDAAISGNIISIEFVKARIQWIFSKDIKLYAYALGCKIFYLYISSMGLFPIGLYGIVREATISIRKKHLSSATIVKMQIGFTFIVMIIAILFTGAGRRDQYSYFYYGRYYEYLILPIIFLGIDYCLSGRLRIRTHLNIILAFLVSGISCILLSRYLTNQDVSVVDTNRVVSFLYGARSTDNYVEMIEYMICVTVLGMAFAAWITTKRKVKWAALIPLIILFFINGKITEEKLIEINKNAIGDNYIAEYLDENCKEEYVYFVDSEFRYTNFYTRMQVLLGEKALKIIKTEELLEIPEGAYFITYHDNPRLEDFEKDYTSIMSGSVFKLYKK